MKKVKKIIKYIKKHATKKELIIAGTGLGLLLIGIISWNVYFSKYQIFAKEEKAFLEAVKGFYKYHPEYLPKEGGVKTKTLAEVYDEGRLEELKVPKGKDICDLDSWVKVYNDNGKYIYHTYLKCGKIESKVDHKGPEITLNGEDTIYISIGEKYEELGVKEVKDNKDGKIDISKVTIDSSNVNTKKLGEYKVTYKAKDKMNNVTTVERKVIVIKSLTNIAKEATKDTNGYYKGNGKNNYVQFSGMLFQIVKVNEDGTVMLMSYDNIANLKYNSSEYENSNIDKYLENVFLKAIHDDKYLVEKEYCVGSINDFNDIEGACSKKVTSKVSLISLDEFKNTFDTKNKSYLCGDNGFTLSNISNEKMVISSINYDNCLYTEELDEIPSIRPVITIKAHVPITSGIGTITTPYKLDDYEYAKIGSKINTRIVGEYVSYSGLVYRIQKIDGDNVVLISRDAVKKTVSGDTNSMIIKIMVPDNYIFNTTDENNPGYIINNEYVDYINDNNVVTSTYKVPIYDETKDYDEYDTKDVTAKIVIPKTYDLFSGIQTGEIGFLYLYLDSIENKTLHLNRVTSVVYKSQPNEFNGYGIRPVITIKGDMIIKSGKGTHNNPYYIGR